MDALLRKWFSVMLFLLPGFLGAQSFYFLNSFGGPSQDVGRSAIQTHDKQFVCVGSTSSYGQGSTDIWLVKCWANGTTRWTKAIGGAGVDWGYSVKETPKDSGLIIAGYTDSFGAGGYDFYLVKTDSSGNVLWSKTYGGANWDFAYSMALTADGGYILAGGTYSYGAGDEDVYVVKTDALGDTLWTKHYGGKLQDEARSVKQTRDGGYIVAGMTKSFGDSVNGDAYILRLNAAGDTLWTNTSGGPALTNFVEDAHDVIESMDSCFYLIGGTTSYSTPPGSDMDIYLRKFTANGAATFYGVIGGPQFDRGEAIVESSPQNFTIVGSTKSYGFGFGSLNVVTYFTDKQCNYAGGGHTYGDSLHGGDAEAYSLCNTNDRGYLMCGYTTGFQANGIPDFMLIKIDSIPSKVPLISGISTSAFQASELMNIYPNPADDYTTICLKPEAASGSMTFELTDVTGRNLNENCRMEIQRNPGTTEIKLQFNRQHLPPGLYFFQTGNGNGRTASKIILR